MTDNAHDTLMSLLKENTNHAERIRSDNDRLFFLNNQLQRYGVARCFTLDDAEAAISKIRAAIKGGAA